jgi:hypothetical protein
MQWDQVVLIIVVAWVVVLSRIVFRVDSRVRNLEKQPPKHKHEGEDILFTKEAK